MANWKIRLGDDTREFVVSELAAGRLRAGWGFDDCDLRQLREMDSADFTEHQWLAWSKFYRLLTDLRVGDRIFAPAIPHGGTFSVYRVTGDYYFDPKAADQARGHTIPVEVLIEAVPASNQHVTGQLRASIWARRALTEMGAPDGDIEELLGAPTEERRGTVEAIERISRAVADAKSSVAAALTRDFRGKEFEVPVRDLMQRLYPGATVEHGRQLDINGVDVLVRVPDPLGLDREIAVQVKHWTGGVNVSQLRDEALGGLRRAVDARPTINAGVVLTLLDELPDEAQAAAEETADELGIDVTVLGRDEVASLFLSHLTYLGAPE